MDIESRLAEIKSTIEISGGAKKVDLLIKNARVINTFSGDIYKAHVAVHKGKVVGFGDYSAKRIIDIKNAYLAYKSVSTARQALSQIKSILQKAWGKQKLEKRKFRK